MKDTKLITATVAGYQTSSARVSALVTMRVPANTTVDDLQVVQDQIVDCIDDDSWDDEVVDGAPIEDVEIEIDEDDIDEGTEPQLVLVNGTITKIE